MLSRVLVVATALSGLAIGALSLSACWGEPINVGSNCAPNASEECCPCPVPEACPDGSPPIPDHCFSDAGNDASSDGAPSSACGGQCVPKAPNGWEGPMPVWFGSVIDAPECPEIAPELVFEGHAAPGPLPCGTCSCGPPLVSCQVPMTWSASSDACFGNGVKTTFDPPPNWDGSCTTVGAIAADKLCGGVPCVQSITVSPPVLIEEQPCIPQGEEPIQEPASFWDEGPFRQFSRACGDAAPWPTCEESGACVPAPGPGFSICVARAGDEVCPDGWPERHVFFGQIDDHRSCEPCKCGPATGGFCEMRIRAFADGACGDELAAVKMNSSEPEKCTDVMHGAPLGSKSAELLAYASGTCTPSGGTEVGDLVLSDAMTFCCRLPTS